MKIEIEAGAVIPLAEIKGLAKSHGLEVRHCKGGVQLYRPIPSNVTSVRSYRRRQMSRFPMDNPTTPGAA